jgi:hypothetical protein
MSEFKDAIVGVVSPGGELYAFEVRYHTVHDEGIVAVNRVWRILSDTEKEEIVGVERTLYAQLAAEQIIERLMEGKHHA